MTTDLFIGQGQRVKTITLGVSQRLNLGPDLWNIMYDGLLRLEMLMNLFIIAYAVDVAAVITAHDVKLAQLLLSQFMHQISGWMKGHKLELAILKNEICLLYTSRCV